ncbi:MAG: septum formation initiator family protein [Actinobacteria bacterium]|uniref:Septum formation initiator n=1 Tax=Nostocoides veronense TaxID=330836 RepID=A0ABP4Y2R9_9MICO|nr:septum formation initiator family protein [Actinomycetota bacterium]
MAATGPRRDSARRPKGRGPGPRMRSVGSSVAGELAQRRSARSAGWWIGGLTIFVMLAFLLGPTLKTYVDQRREIGALQEQVAAQRADVAAMEKEKALWGQDTYVEQQARQRLKFVKKGEKAYEIIDLDQAAEAPTGATGQSAAAAKSRNAWYGQVWESIKIADNPQGVGR